MHVVVIDNASHDGSVRMVQDEFPEVTVIPEGKRRGFGANQNRAIAASSGDVVFLLNPDAIVHEETLDLLVKSVVDNERVAAAGGSVLNDDGSVRQSALYHFEGPWAPFSSAIGIDRLRRRPELTNPATTSGWPSGGACVVRRDVFDAVGGFDEGFFMYAEDTDLFARIVDEGFSIAWVPQAKVTHPFPDESPIASSKREVEKVRSSTRYMRKRFGVAGAVVHRVGMALDALSRVVFLSIPGLSSLIKKHGRTASSLRHRNASRLRYIVFPIAATGLSESATAWNQSNSARRSRAPGSR